MNVSEIINRVRWAVDEEKGYADYETGYMDNIIKASIHDALVWVNTYADSSLLVGTSADSGYVKHETLKVVQDGYLTPTQSLLRIIRVRNTGWHKAVMTPVREDSEEYVMQADETAKAELVEDGEINPNLVIKVSSKYLIPILENVKNGISFSKHTIFSLVYSPLYLTLL